MYDLKANPPPFFISASLQGPSPAYFGSSPLTVVTSGSVEVFDAVNNAGEYNATWRLRDVTLANALADGGVDELTISFATLRIRIPSSP
ncbi:MAG: hypothetical protein JNG84_03365 [Archangium sp.]|nr:hypothetical protein [Archangium sp.]